MDKPQQSLPIRGHVRNKSSTKATRPRSSTKGPLDMDEYAGADVPMMQLAGVLSLTVFSSKVLPAPVTTLQQQRAAASSSSSSPLSPPPPSATIMSPRTITRPGQRQGRPASGSPGMRSPVPQSPVRPAGGRGGGRLMSPIGAAQTAETKRPKDFSFLLKPEIYHPLSTANLPQPFRSSPQQPMPDTPLADLLAAGQFRAAAIVAAQQLTGSGGGGQTPPTAAAVDPTDHARILSLLYTRLACLVLIEAMPLAAQEGKALEDLGSSFYFDPATGAHLAPWELRVLNVRLQAVGFGDPRRAIMSYYDLAREARARAAAAIGRHDHSASELWKGRLAELGLKVAGALIEMDDMAGAAAHLTSMAGVAGVNGVAARNHRRLQTARALLWLHIGDVDAARAEVQRVATPATTAAAALPSGDDDTLGPRIISALCDMADDDYASALSTWRDLREDAPSDEMIGVNLAVCLLYSGLMQEGRAVLESLVDAGYSSHTLLFNLSTMYELCSDHSKSMKQQLAQRMADRTPTTDGWERVNADFKL